MIYSVSKVTLSCYYALVTIQLRSDNLNLSSIFKNDKIKIKSVLLRGGNVSHVLTGEYKRVYNEFKIKITSKEYVTKLN